MNPVVRPELRLRRFWVLAGTLIALAIAVVCLAPSSNLPGVGISDKLQHALAFALLAFWFGSIVVRRDLPWAGLALVLFGGLIEIAQALLGWGRTAEWLDLLADAAGVLAGLLLAATPLGGWARWLEARLRPERP